MTAVKALVCAMIAGNVALLFAFSGINTAIGDHEGLVGLEGYNACADAAAPDLDRQGQMGSSSHAGPATIRITLPLDPTDPQPARTVECRMSLHHTDGPREYSVVSWEEVE